MLRRGLCQALDISLLCSDHRSSDHNKEPEDGANLGNSPGLITEFRGTSSENYPIAQRGERTTATSPSRVLLLAQDDVPH